MATKEWKDGEAGGTPITAAELNRIEDAVEAAAKPVAWADVTGKPSIPTVPSLMTEAVAEAGTATAAATISASVLKAAVVKHAPAAPAAPSAMTAAQANAGTATTGMLVSPKVLADEIDRRVAEAIAALGE